MEVSPYPSAAKMEDCFGYCTGYSAHHSNKLGAYPNTSFFCEGDELLELWKLALHTVPPYKMDLVSGSGPGFPGASPYNVVLAPGVVAAHHLEHNMWPTQGYNYNVSTSGFLPFLNVHGKGGGGLHCQMFGELSSSSTTTRLAGSPPHEAFFVVLQYLGLQELLSMEQVCKSLQGWIRSDTSLWRDLQVEHPLNSRVTDEILTRLCSRAQGYLRSLILEDCLLVSNDAVHEILVTNLMLSKLHLLGRSRVSADGLVKMIQQHGEIGGRKLKQLWIRGLHLSMNREQLRELREAVVPGSARPQFYDLWCDSSRFMDVEECPRCGNPGVIYDCTREKCREKKGLEQCRACISCITRCKACGTCLAEVKYRESFTMERICFECSNAGDMGVITTTTTTTTTGMNAGEGIDDSLDRGNKQAAAAGRG